MSTTLFRNKISEFRRNYGTWVYDLDESIQRYKSVYKILPEDQLILDFIENVDFDTLYRSKEFNEMLDKRLFIKKIHKSLHNDKISI